MSTGEQVKSARRRRRRGENQRSVGRMVSLAAADKLVRRGPYADKCDIIIALSGKTAYISAGAHAARICCLAATRHLAAAPYTAFRRRRAPLSSASFHAPHAFALHAHPRVPVCPLHCLRHHCCMGLKMWRRVMVNMRASPVSTPFRVV